MATKTMTIKQAKVLAAELVLGTAVKTKVTAAVSSLYYRHINDNRLGADTVMIELWCGCAVDKESLAVIRAIFNRVTARIHKELDIDKRAMCVKDGKLVEVQLRGASKGTANGGGEGEGEGDSTAESTGAHIMGLNGEVVSPIEALAEGLFKMSAYAEELARVEQDGEKSQSIIDVDIALCQIREKLLEALEPLDKAA